MLILLVGPKGAGKSYVGRLLEAALGAHFFHVEPLWMAYHAECVRLGREPDIPEGIRRVRPALEAALDQHEHVCVETTGASPEILGDLLSFEASHRLLLVRVQAPLEVCLERIGTRDPTHQIPMELDRIRHVHALSSSLDRAFDITLENVSLSDEEILRALGPKMLS